MVVSWITAFRKFSLESADPISLEPDPDQHWSRLPLQPRLRIQLQRHGPRGSRRSGAQHSTPPARLPGVGPASSSAPPPTSSAPSGSASNTCSTRHSPLSVPARSLPQASRPSQLHPMPLRAPFCVRALSPLRLSPCHPASGPAILPASRPRPSPQHWSPRHHWTHTSPQPSPLSFFLVSPCPPILFVFF